MICMAAVPEPPVMDVGLKATFTPVGCPDAVRAIVPVKPPEGVAVILTLPCPPGATLPFLGVAARVKLPPPELVTVSVTVVVSVVPPEVPFTVMGYTPVAVVPATAIVMPKIRGTDLAKRLRSFLPNVKIIYMSGYLDVR